MCENYAFAVPESDPEEPYQIMTRVRDMANGRVIVSQILFY